MHIKESYDPLVFDVVTAFHRHRWIRPWQGFGYFENKTRKGQRGTNMMGALAVLEGVCRKSHKPDWLLERVAAWRDTKWEGRCHFVYGMSDGWNGHPLMAREYELVPHKDEGGWSSSKSAIDYRAGYEIGSTCAYRMGLQVSFDPPVIESADEYKKWTENNADDFFGFIAVK